MTEAELFSLPKIRVEDAARFLQNGTTAQEIRVAAQNDRCPFCQAFRKTPKSGKYTYRIIPGALVDYKAGRL